MTYRHGDRPKGCRDGHSQPVERLDHPAILQSRTVPGECGQLDADPFGLVDERLECKELAGVAERLRILEGLAGVVESHGTPRERVAGGDVRRQRGEIEIRRPDRATFDAIGPKRPERNDENRLDYPSGQHHGGPDRRLAERHRNRADDQLCHHPLQARDEAALAERDHHAGDACPKGCDYDGRDGVSRSNGSDHRRDGHPTGDEDGE